MKKIFISLMFMATPILSFGNDFAFVLKCDYGDKKSSSHPFYFIGMKEKNSEIIYLKSNGKYFDYVGGENKILELKNTTIDFYEYRHFQKETPNLRELTYFYSLDRKTLTLGEETNTFPTTRINYSCQKESNQEKSYQDAINLKKKYEGGKGNKI
jgi:hypothetical protein